MRKLLFLAALAFILSPSHQAQAQIGVCYGALTVVGSHNTTRALGENTQVEYHLSWKNQDSQKRTILAKFNQPYSVRAGSGVYGPQSPFTGTVEIAYGEQKDVAVFSLVVGGNSAGAPTLTDIGKAVRVACTYR